MPAGADDELSSDDTALTATIAGDDRAVRPRPPEDLAVLAPGGRYERLATLGHGGNAVVYRVHDRLFNRTVAMKMLRPERADDATQRERFVAEAELSAQLQHPGVVPVLDRGLSADGRPWFTMQEVHGTTLREVSRRLHASDGASVAGDDGDDPLRRLLRAFLHICETVAFAHDRGIVHGDLKPSNLMVGDHGQVLVLDWGLARPTDTRQRTTVAGTPAYLSPELVLPPVPPPARAQDVYALGAVLYALLAGRAPYEGTPATILAELRRHGPRPLTDFDASPLRPEALCLLSARCMSRDPDARPAQAREVAEAVADWLDGRQRRARALAIVADADAHRPTIRRLLEEAERLDASASERWRDIKPFDSADRKAPAWDLESEAATRRQQAATETTRWLQLLRSALNEVPNLPEAHERLAAHYRRELVQSERRRDTMGAAENEALLRDHDRGRHAAFLRGDGRLTLVTEPSGAAVTLYRYVERRRRLHAEREQVLGVTPLVEVTLARGSYLLVIEHPDRAPVRYPVLIERAAHWDGKRPGGDEPHVITLPPPASLAPDDIFVPGGWFVSGGDPYAAESLPRRRLWADDFVIKRDPVTNRQYMAFLNALVDQGRLEEAERHAPDSGPGGAATADGAIIFRRTDDGHFLPPREQKFGDMSAWPVGRVDWYGAMAYAAWYGAATGRDWSLNHELEWEKAARGVDGRFAPWGDHVDPSSANMLRSHETSAHRSPVGVPPSDLSPYGVRGMAGNTRDWCAHEWLVDGPVPATAPPLVTPCAAATGDALRVARGGAWSDVESWCRVATRFAARPTERFRGQGFRLRCASSRGPRA